MQEIFSPTNSKRLTFFYRLLSTVALWTVALFIIFNGWELGFFFLIGGIGMVALWEFYTMLDNKKLPNFKIIGMICGGIFISGSFFYFSRTGSMQSYDFEAAVLVLFMLVVFAARCSSSRATSRRWRRWLSPSSACSMCSGFLISSRRSSTWFRAWMEKVMGHFYVLYLIVVTKFSDMGAYVTGSLVGKHPLIPHISPKKTWEGFFGALGFSLFGSYAMRALMPAALHLINWSDCAVLGLMLGFAAIIGDLAESIIKRSCDVKDSGHVLPGIGGTLDLIDSLLFTAPLLFFYMRLVMGVR